KKNKHNDKKIKKPATKNNNLKLTRMDTELNRQIQDLKNNKISLVLTDQDRTGKVTFKIVTVSDRIDEHEADYSRDYLKIKELALNEKQFETIEKWQNEKIMETYIKISEDYKNCDFSGNWLKQ